MYVCMSVCLFVRMSVCMDVCMYVCTYACLYVCMSVCLYVCMCRAHLANFGDLLQIRAMELGKVIAEADAIRFVEVALQLSLYSPWPCHGTCHVQLEFCFSGVDSWPFSRPSAHLSSWSNMAAMLLSKHRPSGGTCKMPRRRARSCHKVHASKINASCSVRPVPPAQTRQRPRVAPGKYPCQHIPSKLR